MPRGQDREGAAYNANTNPGRMENGYMFSACMCKCALHVHQNEKPRESGAFHSNHAARVRLS